MLDIKKYSVSNEGLFGLFKKQNKETWDDLYKDVEKTYLNDNWLRKQELVTSKIDATTFSKYLVIDKNIPKDLAMEINSEAKTIDNFLKNHFNQVIKYYSELKPAWILLQKTQGSDDDFIKIKNIVDSANEKHFPKTDVFKLKLKFGNFIIIDKNGKPHLSVKNEDASNSLDALSVDEIKSIVKAALVLDKVSYIDIGLDPDEIDYQYIDNLDNENILNYKDKWHSLITKTWFDGNGWHKKFITDFGLSEIESYSRHILDAVAKYVDRSIK